MRAKSVDVGADLAVSLLSWPEEDDVRRQLSSLGLPRLLLVAADAAPPDLLDDHEDWVRLPSDPADLRARAAVLLERTTTPAAAQPLLDDDGLLHVGSAWVAITTSQLPVLGLLLENPDRVVRTEDIAAACVAAGTSGHPASVRTLLTRLNRRLDVVGLELVNIRQQGVLLRRTRPESARQ
jgi:hypothetical protein